MYYYIKEGPEVIRLKDNQSKIVEHNGVKLLPLGYITSKTVKTFRELEYTLKGRNSTLTESVKKYIAGVSKETEATKELMDALKYTKGVYRKVRLEEFKKGFRKNQFYLVLAGPSESLKKTVVLEGNVVKEFDPMVVSGI